MGKKVDSIIDGHKIHLHPDKVSQWKSEGDCYPIHIEIGTTNRCNQNCVFCALDFARGKTDIDKDVMLKGLESMAKCGVNSVMFGGEGEPTLHKDLGLFVQKAKQFGLDVALTTNGVLFDKQLQEDCLPYLSWVKFSMDSGTPQTYSKIHKSPESHFYKLLSNIFSSKEFKIKKRLDVTIGIQNLMIPQNMNSEEIEGLFINSNKIKPDYLSIKPYSDHPRSRKDLIVGVKEYNLLEEKITEMRNSSDFEVYFRKNTIERIQEGNNYPECYGLSFISLIDSKGNILPCNIFYGQEEFTYGNLYENSFEEIWKSSKRKEVIKKLKDVGTKSCRNGCRCDAGNRYLHRIKNPESHDNFT